MSALRLTENGPAPSTQVAVASASSSSTPGYRVAVSSCRGRRPHLSSHHCRNCPNVERRGGLQALPCRGLLEAAWKVFEFVIKDRGLVWRRHENCDPCRFNIIVYAICGDGFLRELNDPARKWDSFLFCQLSQYLLLLGEVWSERKCIISKIGRRSDYVRVNVSPHMLCRTFSCLDCGDNVHRLPYREHFFFHLGGEYPKRKTDSNRNGKGDRIHFASNDQGRATPTEEKDMTTGNDEIEGGGCAAPPCSAAPSHARLQDGLDWQVFAERFNSRNGFDPSRGDKQHKEYFHWFTVGAHAEFMGRLNVQQNSIY